MNHSASIGRWGGGAYAKNGSDGRYHFVFDVFMMFLNELSVI
jgi:hypothetical protein